MILELLLIHTIAVYHIMIHASVFRWCMVGFDLKKKKRKT